MNVEIIVALVTSIGTFAGVVLTVMSSNKRIQHMMEVQQAIMNTKLENLTEEVKRHNNFAMEIPSIKTKLEMLEKEVEALKN